MGSRRILLRFLGFLLATQMLCSFAFSARKVAICSEAFLALSEIHQDSAVELEMNLTPPVLKVLTTTDGKVGSVLGKLDPPVWLQKMASRKRIDPSAVAWDDLDDTQKMILLNFQAQKRGVSFFADRNMHGIKVRPEATLQFDAPTTFLGKEYVPGKYTIDLSEYLGKVEYRSPSDLEGELNGVELHFRGADPAGTLSRDAAQFQKGIGSDITHQHVHIVAKIPMEKLARNARVQSAIMGDYFRRLNMYAEMLSIFSGGTLKTNAMADAVYFDTIGNSDLAGVTSYFFKAAQGRAPKIGDNYKMGFVGMRGSDKYDEPGLWGIEFRRISKGDNSTVISQSLNAIQWSMQHDAYGVSPETMALWLEKESRSGDPGKAIASLGYKGGGLPVPANLNKSWPQMIASNHAVEMLVKNWSRDPMFFQDTVAQAKIVAEQKRALGRLAVGEPSSDVMQDFLWDSGIAKKVSSTVMLNMEKVGEEKPGVTAMGRYPAMEPVPLQPPADTLQPATTKSGSLQKFWNFMTVRQQ